MKAIMTNAIKKLNLEFLESKFCQSRKRQGNKFLWDLYSFSQHLPVADSYTSAQDSLKINNVGEKSHFHSNDSDNRHK